VPLLWKSTKSQKSVDKKKPDDPQPDGGGKDGGDSDVTPSPRLLIKNNKVI